MNERYCRQEFADQMHYLFDIMEWFKLHKKGKLCTEALIINNYYDYKMSMFLN